MNSNYVAEIQATCCPNEELVARQHVAVICWQQHVARSGNMLPWCKRGLRVKRICIAPHREKLTSEALTVFTLQTHHSLHLVSVHQTAPPLTNSSHLIAAYYLVIDPKRMKGWVGLVSRPTADGLPDLLTYLLTHQLQVKCRPVKVRRSETDVLPLSYTTNH